MQSKQFLEHLSETQKHSSIVKRRFEFDMQFLVEAEMSKPCSPLNIQQSKEFQID